MATKKQTTEDVLREIDKEFQKERERAEESHERMKDFMREMCDRGLISDVEPSNPITDPIVCVCIGCGKEFPAEAIICPNCPMGTPYIFKS